MSYAEILIPFVGGLGMFIYGMQIMAAGLEHAAGISAALVFGYLASLVFQHKMKR